MQPERQKLTEGEREKNRKHKEGYLKRVHRERPNHHKPVSISIKSLNLKAQTTTYGSKHRAANNREYDKHT